MTTIKTSINREYALRFCGVALLFFVFSGWFVYDGKIGYPSANETLKPVAEEILVPRALTPEEWIDPSQTGHSPLDTILQEHYGKTPSKYSDTFHSWVRTGDERAKDINAANEIFLRPLYSEEDIHTQFISAVIALLTGIIFLLIPLWRKLNTFTYDGQTLTHTIANKTIATYPLSQLTKIDRTEWQKRGILKLTFDNRHTVTLDAWHHEGIKDIVAQLPNNNESNAQ